MNKYLKGGCRYFVAILILFLGAPSVYGLSSLPDAQVKKVGGKPCFTIHGKDAAPQVIKLFSLYVAKKGKGQKRWPSLPESVWGFEISPPGNSIELSSDNCISYGELPVASEEFLKARLLEPYQIYNVDIGGRPKAENSAVLGYGAEFCIKPTRDGDIQVIQIPWDKTAGKWRYDACSPP